MRLEETLGELLTSQGKTIAIAESITGGLISHLVTNVPGSSRYFLATIVSYSNESKASILGVREETLKKHGAVSEETAGEMAAGARRVAGADIGASVTGIAGPTGGSLAKPVGLVFFSVSDGTRTSVGSMMFEGDREAIKKQAAETLLRMIIDFIRKGNPAI